MVKLNYQEYQELMKERRKTVLDEYAASPHQRMEWDFFSRFHRDKTQVCQPNEIEVTDNWQIVYEHNDPLIAVMAEKLVEFFSRCMHVNLHAYCVETIPATNKPVIELTLSGNGKKEDFTISAKPNKIVVSSATPDGIRNGVVRLVGLFGFRMAPFFQVSHTEYTARLDSRMLKLCSPENEVFYGGNSTVIGMHELYKLSTSNCIPELIAYQEPQLLAELIKKAEEAKKYGLKSYIRLSTTMKFKEDDPLFLAHPEIRGTRTWSADGDFVPCTQSELFKQYLRESVEGLFRAIPGLNGVYIIIGGEGFYHCYMRSYGAEWGDTSCPHCKPFGAEQVVSNLCNLLLEAARKANPDAEVIAWPYSALWSKDSNQIEFIRQLNPGVSVMSEMGKGSILYKSGGVRKRMGDYTIDAIGPTKRAQAQIATGTPVHLLSTPEMSFETALLPTIPAPGRWARRSEAMAASGAHGAHLWSPVPFHGSVTSELFQYKWFSPAMSDEELIHKLALRTTGNETAAQLLERAWEEVDDGFDFMPYMHCYYKGPQYLGPANPIAFDYTEELSEVFRGYYCFLNEAKEDSAVTPLRTYEPLSYTESHREGDSKVIETYYRVVEKHLEKAVEKLEQAESLIGESFKTTWEVESFPIRWFYHTARACGNMFEMGRVYRSLSDADNIEETERLLDRFEELFCDELSNAQEALPIAEQDVRFETLWRGDHSFSRIAEMLRAKIELTENQIKDRLPVIREEHLARFR